ncbi:MAG: molybdopterin-dependent oxidoreductase [Deltaproteobacteria bacterium]|nr:molybdopterin-dependent oxidoreductase [Deltaproteobacteria bacterium]MBW2419663.1 molybdopterin-dependent oxidoreductase [Deltaproteobacteria bacterium]
MSRHAHTICRACHAGCGVIVEIEDGRPQSVRGDPNNPLYKGFCCIKGQNMAASWANSKRLLQSQKRQPDGRYSPIPVEQAMDEIAERLQQILASRGTRAIATYSGTMATNAGAANGAVTSAFLKAIGSRMGFNSNTIDQPGKFVAAALFGGWMAPPQHFAQARVALLVGCNPLVAMSGGVPHTNPGRSLTDALKRGLSLIVIDPRRSETARRASVHLQPRPGEDVAILAALIRVILDEELHDALFVDEHLDGVEALREAVAPFTPERVARRADVAAADLVAAARIFARNGPGVATAGTGPNMSGHTTLLEYLLRCLNTICGRWQRQGEQVIEPATLGQPTQARAQAMPPYTQYAYGFGEKLRVRDLANTAAGMPTAALADEILMPGQGQVRALISHGGNPVAAWPDQLKTIEAMKTLDLLVQIDTRMSATAKLADYVVAVKHPLEMPGISLTQEYLSAYAVGFGTTAPYAQYTPALVEPPAGADVIDDWLFFYGLAQRMGVQLMIKPVSFSGTLRVPPQAIDMIEPPSTDELFEMVTRGSRIALAEVRQHPAGAIFPDPPVFVQAKEEGWQGRMNAGNAQMLVDLTDVGREDPSGAEDLPFRLISRRQMNVLNSVGQDNPGQHRGRTYNPAYLHPEDLAELKLAAGDCVEIRSDHASIVGIVEIDRNLRRGLVSMAHSWGEGPERDHEVREIGANTGRLTSIDREFERYTGLPRMSNIPVAIKPLALD